MEYKLSDFYDLILQTDDSIKELSTADEFISLARELKLSRIEYNIFISDKLVESIILYKDDEYDSTSYSDHIIEPYHDQTILLRIYYGIELNEEEKALSNIFSKALLLGLKIRYLTKAYESSLYYDPSTNLHNVVYFYKIANEYIKKSIVTDYTFGYINIKNFKKVNRIFGNDGGDLFIKSYGQKLNELAMEEKGELICRAGGDNFVYIILNDNHQKVLDFIKETTISITKDDDILEYPLSARAGVLVGTPSISSSMQIMSIISTCLSYARENSMSDICFYKPTLQGESEDLNNYLEEINEALKEDKFLIYYQPIIHNDGLNKPYLIAAEALIRWRKHDAMVNPTDFLPIAEKYDLITRIDLYVLEKVCKAITELKNKDITPVPIYVNFSIKDLYLPTLTDKIREIVDKYEVEHNLINIEFTEASFHSEYEMLCLAVNELKENGFLVSIDKFGSGFSSINLLSELDFDTLKIESSALDPSKPKRMIIFEEIISLADKLGISIILEKIDKDLIPCAIELGCNYFQTEYYDKALSERFFINRLKNRDYK